MKTRLRLIFWLMSLCMLGINGFQGYWLYATYQLTVAQFARTAHEALLDGGAAAAAGWPAHAAATGRRVYSL